MSDLSQPPLSLVPLAHEVSAPSPLPPKAAAQPSAALFAWPMPPVRGYGPALPQTEPEPCEIEGPSGKVSAGRLIGIDADAALVSLNIPPARSVLTLKLTQFRRLALTRPLEPLTAAAGLAPDATAPLPPQGLLERCRLRFKDGSRLSIDSVGQVETALGLFTFTPIDASGRLRRAFFPRPMLAGVETEGRPDDEDADEPSTVRMPLDEAPGEALPAAAARRVGDVLLAQQISSHDQLIAAIEQQARMPMVRIGEALLALGMITPSGLADALKLQSGDRSVPLGEMLVRRGVVSRTDLQTALARKMGYPIVDVGAFAADPEAALRLPLAAARRLLALPLLLHNGRLVVALEDPTSRKAIDELEFSAQCKVVPVLARAGSLAAAVERAYTRLGKDNIEPSPELLNAMGSAASENANTTDRLLANLELQQAPGDARDEEIQLEQSDNSLVRLINTMILEAHQQGVSDIHVECQPGREKVKVRFRHDGVLRPYIELPHTYRSALVARIKIMCDLDISERRKPQDGKIAFGRWVQGQKLELRVATIPTANGLEDVVMRLLASARTLPLDGMGLQADTLAQLKAVIERPYGLVLCVGPTGSGKTTTLHAALNHINTPERKIWTAEDPVEITQPGLRQVQVNPKIDWTFAKALRAFLRADPDVIMVGEIRDQETAQVAIEASLTGHLVLSTLHTNSAAETVTRLLDMGMDPFNFADALLGVLAQRLVRRLCTNCRTSEPASAEWRDELLHDYRSVLQGVEGAPGDDAVLAGWTQRHGGGEGRLLKYRCAGCEQCHGTGLRGRMGLHELMTVSRGVRQKIQSGARSDDILRHALADGMNTLRQDGIEKVWAGLTSIEEVRANS
ncbi:MAG: Flp pilus assembly complex ATPase component TadA [Burkholderiaceae bacterium]|nr:Flp pilus assembly complex ATPase component TadA [Burkholderiaceae bacterium]